MQCACPVLSSVVCWALLFIFLSTGSHKQHDLWKDLSKIKCVVWFSAPFLSEPIVIQRRTGRGMIINVCWSSSTRYSCQILLKIEYSLQITETLRLAHLFLIKSIHTVLVLTHHSLKHHNVFTWKYIFKWKHCGVLVKTFWCFSEWCVKTRTVCIDFIKNKCASRSVSVIKNDAGYKNGQMW
jgi:hypothetical protein